MPRHLVTLDPMNIVESTGYVRDDAREIGVEVMKVAALNIPRPGQRLDDAFADRFVSAWTQPTVTIIDLETLETQPPYALNDLVHHNGDTWRSLIDGNVWEPGVANWRTFPDANEVSPWLQPTGAGDAYAVGERVSYDSANFPTSPTWVSKINANTTTPGTDGNFHRWWQPEFIDLDIDPNAPTVPAWAPWTSGLNEDLYQIGDQVSHNGQTWEATFGNNYWEPGVFGWVVI